MIDMPTSLHVTWCASVLWCCDVNGALREKCTVTCGVCFVLLLHASVCVCMCVSLHQVCLAVMLLSLCASLARLGLHGNVIAEVIIANQR